MRFSNDCLPVQLANWRQRDVYVIQSLVPPVQENLVELLLMFESGRPEPQDQQALGVAEGLRDTYGPTLPSTIGARVVTSPAFSTEMLGRLTPFPGKRLAILTNGGGIGVLAVDRLTDLGGILAEFSPDTLKRLDTMLPPIWSRANPVDIAGDADATSAIGWR